MCEFLPEYFVINNYIKNYKKWYEIEKPYFEIETNNKKQKEEYNCIQDLYKEAVAPLEISIEELKEPMDEETFEKKQD